MKRTKTEVISAPFLELYKPANHIDDVKTAKYLLYGVLGDHCSPYRDCEYKFIPLFRRLEIHPAGETETYASASKDLSSSWFNLIINCSSELLSYD